MIGLLKKWRCERRTADDEEAPQESPCCPPAARTNDQVIIPRLHTIFFSSPIAQAQDLGKGSRSELFEEDAPMWDGCEGDEDNDGEEDANNMMNDEVFRQNAREKWTSTDKAIAHDTTPEAPAARIPVRAVRSPTVVGDPPAHSPLVRRSV